MNMEGQVFEDIVGAASTGDLLPFSCLEEHSDTGLELGVQLAKFTVHHCEDLVVVLNAEHHIFDLCPRRSVRARLDSFHCHLQLALLKLRSAFLQDVQSGCQQHI